MPGPRTQPRLGTQLRRSFGALTALVLLLVVISSSTYLFEVLRYQPELRGAVLASGAVRSAHQGMLDQETGVRGFLLNRQAIDPNRLLRPYRDGQREYLQNIIKARELIGSDRRVGPLLREADQRARTWMTRWASAAVSTSATDPWLHTEAFLGRGEALFRSYRDAESQLSTLLIDAVDHTLVVQQRTSQVGAALALAGGLVVTWAVQRQRRRLHASVVDPVDDLAAAVRRVRDGDLHPAVTPSGPRELRLLAEGFAEMTAVLLADRDELRGREATLLEQRNRGRTLLVLTRRLAESLNQSEVGAAAVDGAVSYTESQGGVLWLARANGRTMAAEHRVGMAALDPRDMLEPDESAAWRAAALGILVDRVTSEPAEAGEHRRIAVALLAGERTIGVLELFRDDPRPLSADVVDGLRVFATAAVSALEVARLHQQTLELSQRDPLTGLLNRRRLDEDLPREVALALRYDATLSFLMLDLDHFKRLNDRYGHLAGDAVLRDVAAELSGAVRSTDLSYRFGGEEFCVLLRNTDLPAALLLAERVRRRIGRRLARSAVTVSIGVAAVPSSARDGAELVRRADAALYEAKRAGRNRVVQSQPYGLVAAATGG